MISYTPLLQAYRNHSSVSVNSNTITFFPINITDSLPWQFGNVPFSHFVAGSETLQLRLGLYSLNGSTLSLQNWVSGTKQYTGGDGWMSVTNTSAAYTATPGTWFLGLHLTGASVKAFGDVVQGVNVWPGGFMGGAMTVSTSTLPGSVATSDLDVTANAFEFASPYIILTAA